MKRVMGEKLLLTGLLLLAALAVIGLLGPLFIDKLLSGRHTNDPTSPGPGRTDRG